MASQTDWRYYGRIIFIVALALILFKFLETPEYDPAEILYQAITDRNPEHCGRLSENARYDCYLDYAYEMSDSSVCERAGVYKNNCYISLASGGKSKFKGEKNPMVEHCGEIKENLLRDYCILQAAQSEKQEGLCGEIADYDMKIYCNAIFSAERDECEEIVDEFRYEQCLKCVEEGECSLKSREWSGFTRWW